MFHPITVPFGAVMMFNVVKLKEGVSLDDVELTIGEMCNVVKNTYGDDDGGFIAGQVFKFTGFVSEEGSLNSGKTSDEHIAIVTYWQSFEQHEKSHADEIFNAKFGSLMESCRDAYEIGYEMMWQGEAGD
jgi:hypothetical protein